MSRKTLTERCKSTLKAQKARAKKYGATVEYTAEDLEKLVPKQCRWCGVKLTPGILNFDHNQPLARNGTWTLDNLSAICASDNRKKGALTAHEYERLLQKLSELTVEFGPYAAKNILSRMAAGGAFIYG